MLLYGRRRLACSSCRFGASVERGCASGIIEHVENAGIWQRIISIRKILPLEASPGEQGVGIHAAFFQHARQDDQYATALDSEIAQRFG